MEYEIRYSISLTGHIQKTVLLLSSQTSHMKATQNLVFGIVEGVVQKSGCGGHVKAASFHKRSHSEGRPMSLLNHS